MSITTLAGARQSFTLAAASHVLHRDTRLETTPCGPRAGGTHTRHATGGAASGPAEVQRTFTTRLRFNCVSGSALLPVCLPPPKQLEGKSFVFCPLSCRAPHRVVIMAPPLPYTVFALGDASLHQLHTRQGKVRARDWRPCPRGRTASAARLRRTAICAAVCDGRGRGGAVPGDADRLPSGGLTCRPSVWLSHANSAPAGSA